MADGLGVQGEPRKGLNKTDVERAATHFNVPITEVSGEMVRHVGGIPRGSGLEREEATQNKELLLDILEHQAVGSGRVIDVARAEATPCTCFNYDSREMCWSSGILGLMSSEKNPEQIARYCAVGKIPDGSGAKQRFAKIKGAVESAHKEWEKSGDGLPEWWSAVAKSLEKHKIEL